MSKVLMAFGIVLVLAAAGRDLTGMEQTVTIDLKLQPLKPGKFNVVIDLADQGGNHTTTTISSKLAK